MSKARLLFTILFLSFAAHAQFYTSDTAKKAGEKLAHGDRAGALSLLDQSIASGKDLNDAYRMRATTRFAMGDLRGSVEDLTSAIQLTPDDPQLYKTRAQFRLFLRDSAGALQDFDSAIGHGLKIDEVYVGRARVKSDLGDKDGALIDYRNAIAANPNYAAAYYGIARLAEAKGNLDAAILELQTFIDSYEAKQHGVMPSMNGTTQTGDNVIIKREGKEADGSQSMMAGIGITGFKANSPEELNRAVRSHTQAQNVSQIYFTLGRFYLANNDSARALMNLDKGLMISPTDGQGRQMRADIRLANGDRDGAIEDYETAAASPLPGASVIKSKCILFTLQNDDDAAEKEFDAYVQAYPDGKASLEILLAKAKTLRKSNGRN